MEENTTKRGSVLKFTSNGNGTCYVSGIEACTDKNIVIPDTYDGERVTGIGNLAFYKCGELAKIEIPDCVTSIGDSAFQGCANLTKIEIPESVTKIGDSAFFNCTNLKEIKFIGTSEKWNAVSKGENWNLLAPAEIIFAPPKQKKIMGSKNLPVFRDKSADEPTTKKGNFKIIFAIIPAVLLLIGGVLFMTVHRHDYTVQITNPTCTEQGYKIYTCDCGENYVSNIVEKLGHTPAEWEIITEATKTKDGLKVQKCTTCDEKLAEEKLPAIGHLDLSLISNGDGTCYVSGIGTCTDTDIVIPSVYNGMRVTSIGSYAFYECDGLTSVTIPGSVTSIGNSAFYYCTKLTSIEIPDSVTSIGNYAFYYCTKLTSIEIPDSVTSIGNYAFRDCSGLTSITIPDSMTSIGSYVFSGCSKLKNITFPDGVTSIGDFAFKDCSGLTSIMIPDSVTNIGISAFSGCTGLTSITIGDGITSITAQTFSGLINLTSISIGKNVKNIEINSFQNCKNLKIIQFAGTTAEWNTINKNAYWNIDIPATEVICSDGSVSLR